MKVTLYICFNLSKAPMLSDFMLRDKQEETIADNARWSAENSHLLI